MVLSDLKAIDFGLSAAENTAAAEALKKPHNVWETAIWIEASHRKLVKHSDGSFRSESDRFWTFRCREHGRGRSAQEATQRVGDCDLDRSKPSQTSQALRWFLRDYSRRINSRGRLDPAE